MQRTVLSRHQVVVAWDFAPDPTGELTALPTPPAAFRGRTFKRREGESRGGEGNEGKGNREKEEEREGRKKGEGGRGESEFGLPIFRCFRQL